MRRGSFGEREDAFTKEFDIVCLAMRIDPIFGIVRGLRPVLNAHREWTF